MRNNNWIKYWIKIEKSGNVGLDYFINPVLYPMICDEINKTEESLVVDFGAGTNFLAKELLGGNKKKIFGLQLCGNLDNARKKVKKFIGVEESSSLIKTFISKAFGLKNSKIIEILKHKITIDNPVPFNDQVVDLAISRNLLMHLSVDELESHLKEVNRILKKERIYLVAFLNPEYEQKKYGKLKLHNNEKYEFKHGAVGEAGTFSHYYKDIKTYEALFKKYFKIVEKHACAPRTDKFKKEYSRYYWEKQPFALVYKLKRK
jgi:SAM-dependent methyltransferase